ncbi:MAG TPA: hypothetical protein VF623_13475, partial [Segetibacter sp.]
MKSLFIAAFLLSTTISTFAQKETEEGEEKTHKFRKDNIFLGGAIGLGLGGGGFSAGANPEVGYSIARWLDAGISTNFNYYSITAEQNGGQRQRSFNYGAGVFARIYPIRSIFLQILPEYNIIKTNFKSAFNGEETRFKQEAPSLLLGIGYTSREIGSTSFYTVIMFDAGNNTNSPYIGYLG